MAFLNSCSRLLSKVVLVLVTIVTFGCENGIDPDEEVLNWQAIQESPEFKQLEAIRDEVLTLLVSRQVSKEDFEQAYMSDDVTVVANILGLTPERVTEMANSFHRSLAYFQKEYPEINAENKALEGQCAPADVERLMANYDVLMANYEASSKMAGPSCAVGPYTACLVLAGFAATAVAPTGIGSFIALGAGAIICICEYCEGGFLRWFC